MKCEGTVLTEKPTEVSHGSIAPPSTGETATEQKKGDVVIDAPVGQFGFFGLIPTVTTSAYEATARSVTGTELQDAIRALEGTFSQLEDSVVYAYAFDDEPVGPRIGETTVPESTSKALAGYEWERREKEKAVRETINARAWSLGEKVLLVVVAAAVGALLTWAGIS